MKKISCLLCLFVLLSAFTCENEPLEDDIINQEIDNSDANPSLIGTWLLTEFNADITTETTFGDIDFVVDFTAESVTSDYELVFTASNYTVSGDYELAVSTTVDGETTTYSDAYTNVDGAGTYSTSGNTINVDGSFFEFEFEGMPNEVTQGEQSAQFELSADGQTLTFSQDDVQTQNEGGLIATVTTVSTSVWQKQD